MHFLLGITFLLTLASGIPVAFCLALTSLIFLLILGDVPLILIPQRMFTGMDSFPLMAVPFFIMAGGHGAPTAATTDLVQSSGVGVDPVFKALAENPTGLFKKTVPEQFVRLTAVVTGIVVGGHFFKP